MSGCKKAQRVKTDGEESQANLAGLSIYDMVPSRRPAGRPPQPKNMFDNTIISVGHIEVNYLLNKRLRNK